MQTFKAILLALILISVVVLALANREMVTLNLLPEGMDWLAPMSVEVPLFVVSLVSILLGLVLGYVMEYLREAKHRRQARAKTREAAQLSDELERARSQSGRQDDDILAIVNG